MRPDNSDPDLADIVTHLRCEASDGDHIGVSELTVTTDYMREAATEIERLRTRSAPTNSAEICSKSVVEPTAEHWLTAIVELYGSEADDLTMIEQRARELAQEGE